MARPAADGVIVQWTGTGTGTMSLGSAVAGWQSVPVALNGAPVSYSIQHENGLERESGIGTYTSAGNTLSRDFITFSTAIAPTKQSFSVGTKIVRLVPLAHDAIENRATSDPGLTDDINAGYIEGRARWLNTSTGDLFLCTSHAVGAAVWRRIALATTSADGLQSAADFSKLASIEVVSQEVVDFPTGFTLASSNNGQKLRWTGTSADRLIVPGTLIDGFGCEVFADHDLASLAALTIEREGVSGNRRLGNPIGCRVLRPGGRVRIVQEGDTPRIAGNLDPAAMAAANGGASFLLERGLRQEVAGSDLTAWRDAYGLHDFDELYGAESATVGASGEFLLTGSLGVDGGLRVPSASSPTFAGTALLVGFSGLLASVTSAPEIFAVWDFGNGFGFRLRPSATSGNLNFSVRTNVGVDTTLSHTLPGATKPFALGVAINRTAGYVYGFFDEGLRDRERELSATGISFVVDWTAAPVNRAVIGNDSDAGEATTMRCFAATVRDNLTFANVNDARDQAAAMLAEMRSYHA